MARPLFWGDRKKGLVWFTVPTRLGTPTVVGGANGGNVICYSFIVTCTISVVLYKRVSCNDLTLKSFYWHVTHKKPRDRQKVEFQF